MVEIPKLHAVHHSRRTTMTIRNVLAKMLIASCAFGASTGAFAGGGNGTRPPDAPATLAGSHGNVWYTAAVDSTGVIAGCNGCNKATTSQLATGEYQIGFVGNVTAAAGYSRWVQVDTLTIGSASPVICTTADRSGVVTAVWVACFDLTGTPVNASFFLYVAR
jgi:predicted lipoprotein with Yx(FWY)xxD motif